MKKKYTLLEQQILFVLKIEGKIALEDKDAAKYNQIVNKIRAIKNI